MQGLLTLHTVGAELRGLLRGFDRIRTLRRTVFLAGFQQDQFAGDGNTGRQDNIQTSFTVVSKGDADFCPVRIFLTLHIGRAFLGDKYVVDGFSHDVPF